MSLAIITGIRVEQRCVCPGSRISRSDFYLARRSTPNFTVKHQNDNCYHWAMRKHMIAIPSV